jgi:hypothetical protein
LISQDSIHINPLHVFVKDCLVKSEDSYVRIGTRDSDNDTLYGIYCSWCNVNGISTISFKSFSILLLDLLNQQGWNISKKRLTTGFVVIGVEINTEWIDTAGAEYCSHTLDEIATIDNEQVKIELKITDTDFENN